MKKEVWPELYSLLIQGYPAKKICKFLGRDKAQISRMIKALESSGFIHCINAGDKVKFYEATKKPLTPSDENQLSTILQKKVCKTDDNPSSIDCHAISYQANIKSMDEVKWDKTWKSKGVSFYFYQYPFANIGSISFVRTTGKTSDILKINLPRFTWDARKGSPEPYLKEIAAMALDWFHKRFNLSFSDFTRCKGGHYEIPVTDPDIVKLAQLTTVRLGDFTLDSSIGFPQFGSTKGYYKLQELLSLPNRVSQLEDNLNKLESTLSKVSQQMDRIEHLFSHPKPKDEFRDVT
jgi:hypothetical protein